MRDVPDDPHFPAPGERVVDPYRQADPAPAAEAPRNIVKRAEPPPDSRAPKPKLTREEMNALIAVTAAHKPAWKKSLWRMPTLAVIGVASHLLHAAFGAYAYPIDVVLFVAALAWTARPLFRRDGFS